MNAISEYLKKVVALSKQYASEIKRISKTGEKLGELMRNGFNASNSENNIQILNTIRNVADMFTDIAQSQDTLGVTLEHSLCEPLECFYNVEIAKVVNIQQQYQIAKTSNDYLINKYLQSDSQNFGRGVNQVKTYGNIHIHLILKCTLSISPFTVT